MEQIVIFLVGFFFHSTLQENNNEIKLFSDENRLEASNLIISEGNVMH